ncbi:glutamate 5-kinase [Alishewanella tabrizica]|uniref:Glutamate 5-kinase n=1 Tax=Alishewanella tabrizica TaxID=671278 RepID=A0ABQ2WL04_9ALTE|nr:glutamate 5-kinase [Alishewanella tabrizica]GGW60598.1 glutamate 5-kinase [Alishewanella tabrizica]
MAVRGWKRIVLKVGSALIAPTANGCSTRYLLSIARFIAECRAAGTEVVLVSSGSVAAGRNAISFKQLPLPINVKQAMAAVGQSRMMASWSQLFDFDCAQILLTHDDLKDRRRYLNIDNTLKTLLANGVLPIVNENDTVATAELKVGDNDNLAAMVAIVADADALLICSDIDGLYTANPRTTPTATLLPQVSSITADIYAMAGGSHHAIGTGGMITKIQAADKATAAGIDTLIINGQKAATFDELLLNRPVGTVFLRQQERISAKKHWLRHNLKPSGSIILDTGAVQAVTLRGASLLPSGIHGTEGDFEKGDAVLLTRESGETIAQGITQYSAMELRKIQGAKSQEITARLGYCPSEVAVHRDDLVLF